MQPCSTILGIIEMRLRGISYDDCRRRYGVGNSTITLIMDRYTAHGVPPGGSEEAKCHRCGIGLLSAGQYPPKGRGCHAEL